MRRFLCAFSLLILFFLLPLQAGGPNAVLPEGVVVKWDSSLPVRFLIDQGTLGFFPNEVGANMVRMGFQKWEDVGTGTIFFQDDGFFPTDITLSNYAPFLDEERTDNPIIFDTNGQITDDLLGSGARQVVAGFTSIPSFDTNTNLFISGFLVLNGVLTVFTGEATTRQLVTHEIGHLIGLDHTQAGHSLGQDMIPGTNQFVPVMYPFLLPSGPQDPLRDDSAWLSWLYPEADFRAGTGTITGKILRRTGGPFLGANVVAVQVDGAGMESVEEVVSVVSDFLLSNDGSYELPGLPPGDYVVFIEALDTQFTGGSSVGPYLGNYLLD